jgi:choline dehydrogenase-like flavoprotein
MGVSGSTDDLAEFFGDMGDIDPPAPLDVPAAFLFDNYLKGSAGSADRRFRLGRGRNAVITQTRDGRKGCTQSALCLWGCSERSIYNAAYDVSALQLFPNFKLLAPYFVEHIRPKNAGLDVLAEHMDTREAKTISARRVILAAGAIGTGRLVHDALDLFDVPIRLLSNPTAALALLVPRRIGTPVAKKAFGLSQISFVCDAQRSGYVFGNIFGTAGLPVREFITRSPISTATSRAILRLLLPSMLVGNCWFHGAYSDHVMTLKKEGGLVIKVGMRDEVAASFADAKRKLSKGFRRLGAFMIPGSFVVSRPGSDLHYAGTVPMRSRPAPHELSAKGEVAGIPGLFVADAAALSALPPKPHTFTAMANADRIASCLANHLGQQKIRVCL